MAISSYNDLISRICSGYEGSYFSNVSTTTTGGSGNLAGTNSSQSYFCDNPIATLPTPLPSGVSSYVLVSGFVSNSTSTSHALFVIGKLVDMGSLNISTNVFTDGAVAPTRTEGGVSRQIPLPILVRASTALNSTPGSLTITYTDQDGNLGQTTASLTLAASAAINTCAFAPLAVGDTGAVDITAASRSGGTSPTGTLTFYGFDIISVVQGNSSQGGGKRFSNIFGPFSIFELAAGDELRCIIRGSGTGSVWVGATFVGNS